MEPQTTIHERRQLNYEIELAFIAAAEASTMIHVTIHTGMGGSSIDLYRRFYSAFDYLFSLTCNQRQLEKHQDQVKIAGDWLQKEFDHTNDNILIDRCKDGYDVFMKYNKLITEHGLIALPTK